MTKQTEFQKQLSDPRWQKKRLEILERDEWTCKRCKDTETTLTVHHKSYRQENGKFVDYWDYDNQHLITLCNPCHEQEEIDLLKIKNELFYTVRELCEDASAIDGLTTLLRLVFERKMCRIECDDFAVINDLTDEMFNDNTTSFFKNIAILLEED